MANKIVQATDSGGDNIYFNQRPTYKLTITRTENDYVTEVGVSRFRAYATQDSLFFCGNLAVAGGAATSDFVEIGSIANWSAAWTAYATVLCQTSGTVPIVVMISTSGVISISCRTTPTVGFYRFNIAVPKA